MTFKMTYMILYIVVLTRNNFKMIMNHHNSLSHAFTILLRHSGILGVAWPPTVFYFSSKNGSTNHNETFSIVFLTKFLTNSWKEKIIGPFFFDLWMFKTLRGSDDPRLGGWRLSSPSGLRIHRELFELTCKMRVNASNSSRFLSAKRSFFNIPGSKINQ